MAARAAFFCDLCQKGYARANEYAAHESSYDHTHKKRLKELKAMDKSMSDSVSKARRNEEKAAGIIKINPIALGSAAAKREGGGGFKKGGFRSAFGKAAEEEGEKAVEAELAAVEAPVSCAADAPHVLESDDEDYENYNPRRPTGCPPNCKGPRQ